MRCEKRQVSVSIQLSEGSSKSLTGAVCRGRSKGKLNVLGKERSLVQGKQKIMTREAGDGKVAVF